jgi:hypothetical protein
MTHAGATWNRYPVGPQSPAASSRPGPYQRGSKGEWQPSKRYELAAAH